MSITIYHNPKCGTSRKVLAALEEAGHQPEVVEYLKTGWTAEQLHGLFTAAGISAGEALRTFKTNAGELGLTRDGVAGEEIIAAMVSDPVLVNRPFVVTPKGTALCRPPEKLADILP